MMPDYERDALSVPVPVPFLTTTRTEGLFAAAPGIWPRSVVIIRPMSVFVAPPRVYVLNTPMRKLPRSLSTVN